MKTKIIYSLAIVVVLLLSCKQESKIDFSFAENERYMVFLPVGYDQSEEYYPVLYMLHGHGGDYMQWYSITNLKQASDKYKFIIITPEGFHDTWYLNSKIIPSMQYEDYFINDFMRRVESQYRIDTSRRGVTGLSMGGHGAIKFICKYPEKFLAAGSTSGILDITMFTDRWGLKKHLGNYEDFQKNWEENSCNDLVKFLAGKKNQLFVDCGVNDFAIDANREFQNQARIYGVKLTYKEFEGSHTYDYWSKSILHQLEFFDRVLSTKKE